MKSFNIPDTYRSQIITAIKNKRIESDHLKKDLSPTELDFGAVKIFLARHFGFCYGVENAIEIAYKAIAENSGRKIYLLSEIIHNPYVNLLLLNKGVEFIMNTSGTQLIPWDKINAEDIIIIPAFGTTLEIEAILRNKGIECLNYNSTCPFVEKVWTRAAQIGKKNYTVIIHGNPQHEETRATFSHSRSVTPTVVIRNLEEASILGEIILEQRPTASFYELFKDRYSLGFDARTDLAKIGVVNQTTMLAGETQAIADYIKNVMIRKYQLNSNNLADHFADTRDTLCYATHDNQSAVLNMLNHPSDLALVVGGYNSSNTSHLVEILAEKLPTYLIFSDENLISNEEIQHWDIHSCQLKKTTPFLPEKSQVRIHITSGASCPDILMERVILKLLSFYGLASEVDSYIKLSE